MERLLVLQFTVDDGCSLSDDDLLQLADRIVAEQIDPHPPVLTWDGAEVTQR